MEISIIVSPKRTRDPRAVPSVYDARLSGQDQVLCSSNTVFLDAARALLKSGRAEPDDVLIMQHAGSDTVALQASIGAAAKLTVEERDDGGHPVRFVPWKAMDMAAVSAPMRKKHCPGQRLPLPVLYSRHTADAAPTVGVGANAENSLESVQ